MPTATLAAAPTGSLPIAASAEQSGFAATDPAGDSPLGPWSDLLGVSFAEEDRAITVRWTVAGLEGMDSTSCWNLDLRVGNAYWVLFATVREDGVVAATVRDDQFITDAGSPAVETETHHVLDGVLPVEVTGDAPATFTLRYDPGAFPATAGTPVRLSENAFSCKDGPSPVDTIAPGETFLLPEDTWRPAPSGLAFAGRSVTTLDPCENGDLPELDEVCIEVPPEARGAAYTFTSTPANVVTKVGTIQAFAFMFHDETGSYYLYGEPGGIPRMAARFGAQPTAPMASWEMRLD